MIEFDKSFERQCEEYLSYLYEQAEFLCSDCTDLDMLVQDTLMVLVVKMHKGETVEYPKGFLLAVLKNKYNLDEQTLHDKFIEYETQKG